MNQIVQKTLEWMQRRLLWLLLCSYALAWLVSGPGLRLRGLSAGSLPWVRGGRVEVSLPLILLAFLLANAGFGARVQQLRHLTRYLGLLGIGLAASTVLPILFALAVSLLAVPMHDDELQNILVGLALIGSMPVSGSSTAWSQNAGGNPVLSLGLVLLSTLCSPLITPVGLHLVGYMARGDYAEDLDELAFQGSSGFLIVAVVMPSLVGMLLQRVLGSRTREVVSPTLKLLNLVDLLVLNYSNASSALPQAFSHPDWDLLLIIASITTTLCVLSFGLGGFLARCMRADAADRLALMFGLGMTNNGTGLVLASVALPDHPGVMLPIIFYNLVQQIVAGVVDVRSRRVPPQQVLRSRSSGPALVSRWRRGS
ncbi:bile acid:sodium symporter family protein [Sorangium sp. So ce1000]|uniref:bile acid:sodium symporter family protein n=1 Tax=Sorangium sp. So ce1000 TaxID=3133325 RepID=UPI003F637E13